MAGRKTVYKRFCPVTQTRSLVWPHELAYSHSLPERLRPARWKGHYLVVELVRALWWISVDEEVARSDSLINNDHGPLFYGLGPGSNNSFNGIGLELLAYMDVWDDWIKWNLCLDLHSELSSLMCHRWKKQKRKNAGFSFPADQEDRLSGGICDPGQTHQHTEHGSARSSSLLWCKGRCCPWCWNSLCYYTARTPSPKSLPNPTPVKYSSFLPLFYLIIQNLCVKMIH